MGQLGCFVLKKGAIENYYHNISQCVYNEKTSAAVEEVSYLEELGHEGIKDSYSDVIHALEYVSVENKIDESFAVKKELLSELALVLGLVKCGKNEDDIYTSLKQSKNNSESLFCYNIIKQENSRKGVEVRLKSDILKVTGFPFKIFEDENVNLTVEQNVKNS